MASSSKSSQIPKTSKSSTKSQTLTPTPDSFLDSSQYYPFQDNNSQFYPELFSIPYDVLVQILVGDPLYYALSCFHEVPEVSVQRVWHTLEYRSNTRPPRFQAQIADVLVDFDQNFFRSAPHLPMPNRRPDKTAYEPLVGYYGTIWIFAVLFKSNDILQKQTALKGERKFLVLISITVVFMLHVVFVYWWYQNDDLMYPLVLLPPTSVPPFWHALFIILVNDSMARQTAMVFKCLLLMYYKNTGGNNYRKQGQMLTLVEFLLLLYRTLLPTPVWYWFFLNKEYGSIFSSVAAGLYLTFKLTSVIQKVRLVFAALRALSHKELHYNLSASTEQVTAAGDLCAICQEKWHSPIVLPCQHIFCEECVSEWFDRERTCPLCRALVKPADIKSYSDGSTSLFFQFF